ncbi:MAG: queuosine precursor transporter [Polyangiales bacterium]
MQIDASPTAVTAGDAPLRSLASAADPACNQRREWVFLWLSALFLGTLAMMNVLGLTHFIDLSFRIPGLGFQVPMPLAVGVLPYPVTFLCTDLISEFYGRRRASQVVWVGFGLNLWVMLILWLGGVLPPLAGTDHALFARIRTLAFTASTASMAAYLVAQFIDVQLYHFYKKLTGGRHLWLRNNGSTLISQLVDAIIVMSLTHFIAAGLPIDPAEPLGPQLLRFIAASYVFKLIAALLDTLPFYGAVYALRRYFGGNR